MIKKSDRGAKAIPPTSQADPGSGSAFLLEAVPLSSSAAADVSVEQQSLRGIELFKAALANGNLTAAASALKHLSELHGLNRPKDGAEGSKTEALAELSDEELDTLIDELLA